MDSLKIEQTTLTWLNGGVSHVDGGALFGPVPKVLWSRRYPCNEDNLVEMPTEPILIQHNNKNYLIDAGIGKGRFSAKERRNKGVSEEATVSEDLNTLGLSEQDIDIVLMTHLHYDHVTGLTKIENDELVSTYPNAKIVIEKSEWIAMKEPSKRNSGSYWRENWLAIESQVELFEGYFSTHDGIEMFKTSGHSEGHSIVKLTVGEQVLVHLADIFITHAHFNSLWVSAFDDYPLRSIEEKEKWINEGVEKDWIFLFYHDAYYRAIQFNKDTKTIKYSLKRSKKAEISLDDPV